MFTWVYHGLPYKRGAFTHKTDNLELIDLSIYLMVKMMVKTMVPTYDFPQQIHPLNSQEALAALAFVAGWPAKKNTWQNAGHRWTFTSRYLLVSSAPSAPWLGNLL
jgi:hypothetical protein